MLLNDAKYQGDSFYRFLVINGKPNKITPHLHPTPSPRRLRLRMQNFRMESITLI